MNLEKRMLDYLNYLFPEEKFTKKELNIFYALFVKGYDEGWSDRVKEESED